MSRILSRRRIVTTIAASIAMTLVAGVAFALGGWSCVDPKTNLGFGDPIVGIAARSQIVGHYRIEQSRFSADCRPDRQGLVTIDGDTTAAVVSAMTYRAADSVGRLYRLYGLDRALTSQEKSTIEQDVTPPFLGRTSPVLQMPVWIEGLAVGYNLSCPTGNDDNALKLSSAALSGIFSGTITTWSDRLINVDNPGLTAAKCPASIRVAVRSDVTEQTALFKDYLSKRNSQWNTYKQPQLNTQWPALLLNPCRGRGDAGVADCVAGQSGAIGYVAYGEARKDGLAMVAVENSGHGFVKPSVEAFKTAAGVPAYPQDASLDWSATTLTDEPVGYPICGLQFAVAFQLMRQAYAGQVSESEVRTTRDYVETALGDRAQARLDRYGLAALPAGLLSVARAGAGKIGYDGT